MKKTLQQRVAALAVAALALTGTAAVTVATAAPAQAVSYKNNFVWNKFGAPGKKCSWHTAIDYSWQEEFFGGYRDYTVFNNYVADHYCGH